MQGDSKIRIQNIIIFDMRCFANLENLWIEWVSYIYRSFSIQTGCFVKQHNKTVNVQIWITEVSSTIKMQQRVE